MEQEQLLRRVHEGLVGGTFEKQAPLKYRSLQLTGDEKKLRTLVTTKLFGPGRLDLGLLGCLPDVLPMPWEEVSDAASVIVFENAGAFTVAREALSAMSAPPFGMVGYGGGAGFEYSVRYLKLIGRPVAHIAYVGDIDRDGLRIVRAASVTGRREGLPDIVPASDLHRAMLDACRRFGSPSGWPHASASLGSMPDDERLVAWLPADVHEEVRRVLEAGHRVPEEILGPDELSAVWSRPGTQGVAR
jgi:hypothetical protein